MPATTVRENLCRLRTANRRLAAELGKLPEIRHAADHDARAALENLLILYRLAPGRFDSMFHRMDTIGRPDDRQYCAPLQALFWMIEDEKMSASGRLLGLDIMASTDRAGRCRPRLRSPTSAEGGRRPPVAGSDYALKKVLDTGWDAEARLLRGRTLKRIIRRLRRRDAAQEYALLARRRSRLQIEGYIMDDFLRRREIFDRRDWPAIADAVRQSRWKRFYTVADRLNAPELVSYYIDRNFFFRKTPASGVYFTFFEKKAQCTDAAYFAQFMLERAGYRTFMRSVRWSADPWDGLHTGAGIILNDGRFLLVANFTGINAISGPFATVSRLDEKLSCQRKVIDRKWGAFYPPRYF